MSKLVLAETFDSFRIMKDVDPSDISQTLLRTMRGMDEREEMEPFLRLILADDAQTPHGPAELVDIFTHKLTLSGSSGMAAFILKGKSFSTIRPSDVSHQIYRLEKIDGLRFAIFAAAGTILDQAKEQFCSTCERVGLQYAFLDATELARVFIAAGFFCPRDGARISSGRCNCGYAPKHRFLNILQQDALESLNDCRRLNQRAGLVVLPPGSGKTRIAAEDAKRFAASRILYVAHTQEILDVAESEFEGLFGVQNVERLSSIPGAGGFRQVSLATIQLLSRHLEQLAPTAFDYVIVDEFHHAAAKSYRLLIDRLSPQFLLGLTATPFRGDQQDIWRLCGEHVVVRYDLRGGIEAGVLVPYHYFGCFDNIDYASINASGGNYTVRDLERALIIPQRDEGIIDKWKERGQGRQTLAFCCSVRHAERVAASFTDAAIPADSYTGNLSREAREKLLARFKAGELKVLTVVDVMNEGADLPFVECLLFLRPTDSKRIFFQQLGRGLRRFAGKSHCIVIDFIGNFRNAYRIVEYQGLVPMEEDDGIALHSGARTIKEMLNLPVGCEVHFEDRVIDIFASQALKPSNANRHNIGRILIYQYERLKDRLGHAPSRAELDRSSRLSSDFYATIWGSWKKFQTFIGSSANTARNC